MIERSPRRQTRHPFFVGFIALFPLVMSLAVLGLAWLYVSKLNTPIEHLITRLISLAEDDPVPAWISPAATVATVVLFALLVYLIGLIVLHVLGPRLVRWVDRVFGEMPVFRYIYPHARALSDFLFGRQRASSFRRVVAVEWPSKGVWSIGFVTSDGIPELSLATGKKLITVFVPNSPAAFSGWTSLCEESQVIPLKMTVNQAIRFIVTCGVVLPAKPGDDGAELGNGEYPMGEGET